MILPREVKEEQEGYSEYDKKFHSSRPNARMDGRLMLMSVLSEEVKEHLKKNTISDKPDYHPEGKVCKKEKDYFERSHHI